MQPKDLHGGLAFFFEQDHRDCEARWVDVEELLSADDLEMAADAWQKYEASMHRHMAMEEEVLLPALETGGDTSDVDTVEAILSDHEKMRGLLEKVGKAIDYGDVEQAMELGDRLLILVQKHNDREETALYPMAEGLLEDDWDEMSETLAEYQEPSE